jgi:hypothetical protein
MTKIIEENGVKVRFPDNNYFQFGACIPYQKIKGHGVKETDICWFDTNNDTLWLVELKAFDNPANLKYQTQDLSDSNRVEYWLTELANKSIHSICMSLTNRSATQSCMPSIPNNNTKIRIVHLLKVMPGQESYLDPMQDKLRNSLKPYTAIFNISAISIISRMY